MKNLVKILALLAIFLAPLMADSHFKSGDNEVFIFSLKSSKGPADKLIPSDEADKKLIANYAKNGAPNEHNVLLIKNKDFIALVDTGYENTLDILLNKLKAQNVKPEQVTHIILTHAHPDHIGGLGKVAPNFVNAALLIDKNELDFWQKSDNEMIKAHLNSYKDKTSFFKEGDALISPNSGIYAISAYGHTPGHNIIDMNGFIFVADIFHAYELQSINPQIALVFDSDPKMAIDSRLKVIQMLQDSGASFAGTHMPTSAPLTMQKGQK